ncbi:MAG: hypothetical protein H0X34_07845 [Chthoniobacterales bacterium]|nr:hypothetical protein [Chthoniobacterales bacterium]
MLRLPSIDGEKTEGEKHQNNGSGWCHPIWKLTGNVRGQPKEKLIEVWVQIHREANQFADPKFAEFAGRR